MTRLIKIHQLPDNVASFEAPFDEDYALLLVVASNQISDGTRNRLASDIVRSRCQYALTFGDNCEVWHDVIDESCYEEDIPEDRFLMTTWHEHESLEDVIDFLWSNTSYDDFDSQRLAVITIGANDEFDKVIRNQLEYLQQVESSAKLNPIKMPNKSQ